MYLQSVAAAGPVPSSGTKSPSRPGKLITQNPCMRALIDQAIRLAASHATVLIQGESGTGKELLAHLIHQRGPRGREPFVAVNCAGLPEGVLESELFGHERGAFTGAVCRRSGRFELANRGTVFLDEIGAAEARVQLRLLRVLQEQEFERVGGTQTLRVDTRVIAATNADLAREVKEGRFRADLYYRLSVIPLEVPPLRARREDIRVLAEHFVGLSSQRNGRRIAGITPDAMARLQEHPWPGNVRQLENAVEHMVVMSRSEWLGVEDVPRQILEWRRDEQMEELGTVSYREARALFERRFLCEALRQHSGVISRVAEAIGMSRKNLYMRLGELRIDYDGYRR